MKRDNKTLASVLVGVMAVMSIAVVAVIIEAEPKQPCKIMLFDTKADVIKKCGKPDATYEAKFKTFTQSEWNYGQRIVGFYNDDVGYMLGDKPL